jgi:hypothetical protein
MTSIYTSDLVWRGETPWSGMISRYTQDLGWRVDTPWSEMTISHTSDLVWREETPWSGMISSHTQDLGWRVDTPWSGMTSSYTSDLVWREETPWSGNSLVLVWSKPRSGMTSGYSLAWDDELPPPPLQGYLGWRVLRPWSEMASECVQPRFGMKRSNTPGLERRMATSLGCPLSWLVEI